MLRLAEEILLLVLDEERGELVRDIPPHALNVALAGAVLMDLALEDRIDTDLEQLVVIDPTPLADDLLDPVLADIAREAQVHDTSFWIARGAERGEEIRDRVLVRLSGRGILQPEAGGLFFLSQQVSRSRRYPARDGQAVEEVRLRIMRVLFDDDLPDPRDIVIICLADACGVLRRLLSRSELDQVQERIELVRKMDLIARSVTEALRRIEPSSEPRPSASRRSREIPHAPGLPLAGNALSMAKDLHAFLIEQYRELGPIFRIRAFNRRFIVLAGPEANLFAAQGGQYFRSHETWRDYNMELGAARSMVGMDGAEHVRVRRAHAQVYSRKLIEGRTADAFRIVEQEIAQWTRNEPVTGLHAFQRIVTEQLGTLATGTSPRDYADDLSLYFDTVLSTHVARNRPRMMMWRPRVRRARKRVMELVRTILAEHEPERRRGEPPDFVDDLLELHRADPHFFPEADLPLLLLGPFIAGLGTVAGVCAFMLYALLKHPDLLERMTAEADDLFRRADRSGGGIGVKDLRRLDVTQRVAMEAMRIWPLTAVTHRTVANSFEFDGCKVPAGEAVLLGFAVSHHMPEYFPDPECFDIERYTVERAEHQQRGAYAPFGVGAHQCLGRSLAEVLIAINMATVVHEAEFVLDPAGYSLKTRMAPHLLPHDSFKFRVVRRRSRPGREEHIGR